MAAKRQNLRRCSIEAMGVEAVRRQRVVVCRGVAAVDRVVCLP